MKSLSTRLLIAAMVVWCAPSAHAAITCSPPTSAGFATAWTATSVVPNTTQTSVTVTCSRLGGDPTVVYLRANNSNKCGGGGNNDARIGAAGNCISYEFHKNSACSSVWSNNGGAAITVSIPAVGVNTVNVPVWGCITIAGQNPGTAGTYTDSVVTSLRPTSGNGNPPYSSGTITASITFPASCTITSITNVAFGTYVAFRATALPSTGGVITLNCTTNLPYTMALDFSSGVVVGLNYTLALSTGSSRGTGPGQTHTITGTMPANQAGTCTTGSCSGSNTHTLTVTY